MPNPAMRRVSRGHLEGKEIDMHENDIGTVIVDCAVRLHQELGPGLMESVYEFALARRLARRGLARRAWRATPQRAPWPSLATATGAAAPRCAAACAGHLALGHPAPEIAHAAPTWRRVGTAAR